MTALGGTGTLQLWRARSCLHPPTASPQLLLPAATLFAVQCPSTPTGSSQHSSAVQSQVLLQRPRSPTWNMRSVVGSTSDLQAPSQKVYGHMA